MHFEKIEKRYKFDETAGKRVIKEKQRPIKYASHKDACIFSYYASLLNVALDRFYEANSISENVIAYRALGRGNYEFSAEAFKFATENSPTTILAFDVTGFFDSLDHGLLKQRIKTLLGCVELSADWYSIYRAVTNFHYVLKSDLQIHPVFGRRLKSTMSNHIATIEELKSAGIVFHPNPELEKGEKKGIPQGTPISATLSNGYMIDFDVSAKRFCDRIGALFRRYSDDILVVCRPEFEEQAKSEIDRLLILEKLKISADKTEITFFDLLKTVPRTSKAAQYLGFVLDEDGATIRESSLSRQWRKMRRAIKRTRKIGVAKILGGKSTTIHTKRLQRRFSFIKVNDGETVKTLRNFSSYARRSADAFEDGQKIVKQAKRLERAARAELAALKAMGKP